MAIRTSHRFVTLPKKLAIASQKEALTSPDSRRSATELICYCVKNKSVPFQIVAVNRSNSHR
jgi:hypothetical protein